ncbi:MerR family transcriptional regulator [Massilia sp. PWRC2]|uniref:MerR family transcriptional regulator n=1 Tax=Massilia sp. PWRC2 TaxID=2804626 RepID=UPI003CF34C4A
MLNNHDQSNTGAAASHCGYRSGVAARLAGLSAATLRVWERRYQLTDSSRSANGQRLYTQQQVRRLGLLKQLVDQGHPIGTLAALAPERLQAMAAGGAVATSVGSTATPVTEVAAIGAGLVRRLEAAIEQGLPLILHRADSGPAVGAAARVLLVEMAEPDGAEVTRLMAAREKSGASAVVVLYRFCSSATVRTLRGAGFMVARFPAEMGELPLLCRAALHRHQAPAPANRAPARFDALTLAAISADGSAGTDPRRDSARALADMLLQVGSFERYSATCADADLSAARLDAVLHRELEDVAGRARALLEQAMGRLLRAGE